MPVFIRFVSSLESADDACVGMGLQPLNPEDGGDGVEEKDRRTAPWCVMVALQGTLPLSA